MKGLITLFTSGAIFAPQILFGVILGIIFGTNLKIEQTMRIFSYFEYYVTTFCFVGIYVFLFKRVKKNDEGDTEWKETLVRLAGYFLMFLLANLLTVSFVFSLLV